VSEPSRQATTTIPAPKRPRRRLSVLGAMGWFAASYGGAVLGYLAINAFAARMLGTDFGYFVLAVTLSTLLGQLGLVGVHRGGLREAARMSAEDTEALGQLRRGVRAVSLVVLPLTTLVTVASTYLLVDGVNPETRWSLAIGMGGLVYLSGQQKLWANYLRGFGHVRFASLLEGRSGGAIASALQGLALGALLLYRPEWGLAGALAAVAIGFLPPVIVGWLTVHRIWSTAPGRGPLLRDSWATTRKYWHFAANLLGGYLNSTIELWIAAWLLTASGVSLFSAAQRLSVLLALPLVSLGVVFSPVVARLVHDDSARLERLLRTAATLAAVVTAVLWVPMLLAPEWLLIAIYGDLFGDAAPILILLTAGSIVNVLSGLCGTALSMSQHERLVSIVQWGAVVLRVGAGVLAASQFGATGLGASAAIVTSGLYVAMWLLVRRRMGIYTHLTLRPSLRLLRQTSG
jgi:O-antigen/teichoic acid export membrane protein